MKFAWEGNSEDGGSAIIASPERYDAVTYLHQLMIDGRPRVVSADRLAVAATLAFGPDASGPIEFPLAVVPAVAQAIQEYLDPTWVTVAPIDFVPKALPIGVTRMHLTVDAPAQRPIANRFDEQRTVHFDLRRSDRYSGQLMSLDQHIVVSNAWMFGEVGTKRSFAAALAVGVLFAESLQVDVIECPQLMSDAPEAAAAVNKLLQSCRLALDVSDLTNSLQAASAGQDSRESPEDHSLV